jgi:hypothetical protein
MKKERQPGYWIFSNRPSGHKDNLRDQSVIIKTKKYSIAETENNRKKVKPGDIVCMRAYGQAFIGKFVISGEWKELH